VCVYICICVCVYVSCIYILCKRTSARCRTMRARTKCKSGKEEVEKAVCFFEVMGSTDVCVFVFVCVLGQVLAAAGCWQGGGGNSEKVSLLFKLLHEFTIALICENFWQAVSFFKGMGFTDEDMEWDDAGGLKVGVRVCVCACLCVCMLVNAWYVCMYMYVYMYVVYMYVRTHVCMHAGMYPCMYVCMYVCTRT
jgi:hypothetical protein